MTAVPVVERGSGERASTPQRLRSEASAALPAPEAERRDDLPAAVRGGDQHGPPAEAGAVVDRGQQVQTAAGGEPAAVEVARQLVRQPVQLDGFEQLDRADRLTPVQAPRLAERRLRGPRLDCLFAPP